MLLRFRRCRRRCGPYIQLAAAGTAELHAAIIAMRHFRLLARDISHDTMISLTTFFHDDDGFARV